MDCCGRACGADRHCVRVHGCAPAGEICGDAAACCSGRCDPDTAGVLRCAELEMMSCNVLGEVCMRDDDCCSRLCADDASGARRCHPAGGCRQSGERCGGGGDGACCSGSCEPSVDQVERCCRPDGQRCGDPMHFDGACCSGTCGMAPDGQMRCGAMNGCEPIGDPCERDDQCCSAPGPVCKEGLTHPRRCLDTGPCLAAGTTCAVPDQCCGGVCAPGPGGALVCHDACLSAGAACTSTADCCAGTCTGTGTTMTCSGVVGLD
jgi:hypothetical protein